MKRNKIGVLLLGLLGFLGGKAEAHTYYFSSSKGDDSRSDASAQNRATPWKSLEKLNAIFLKIQPGDSILFKCGDIFFGTIDLQSPVRTGLPVVFSGYGKGPKPVITGLIEPGNWKQILPAIWEAEAGTGLSIYTLVIQGRLTPWGRYPNVSARDQGYLPIIGFTGSSAIAVKDERSWAGGEVVIRKNHWVLDRNTILESKGSSISYSTASVYQPEVGNGYFIENHPSTLDQNGEWYYNRSSGRIRIYFTTDPGRSKVQVAVKETLLNLYRQHDLLFSNLAFTGSNRNALQINECQHIRFSQCTISCSGKNAVDVHNTHQLSLEDCLLWQTNNIAFRGEEVTGTALSHNTIRLTGMNAGMGEGDSGSYEAILMNGNENTIDGNRIDSTGYIPISFRGNSVHITHNYITNFALIKDDGGGIYTWNNGDHAPVNSDRIISNNIIIGGKGAPEGIAGHSGMTAHGIYIDDNSAFVKLFNNTISGCAGYGIYIHNAHDIGIDRNTVFDNAVQFEYASDHPAGSGSGSGTHISLLGNTFFSKLGSQPIAEFKTADLSIAGFSKADSNIYARPLDENQGIHVRTGLNSSSVFKDCSLSAWKVLTGYDTHSKSSALHLEKYSHTGNYGGAKLGNLTFDTSTDGCYAWSAAGNMKTAWARGPLDGGTLKLVFNPLTDAHAHGSLIVKSGSIIKGRYYLLHFSCLGGPLNKMIPTYLRQSTGSYKDLSERELYSMSDRRTDHTLLFMALATEPDASIVFDIDEQKTPVYFDSISLSEVNGSKLDVNRSMKLYYNSSALTKTIKLDRPGRNVQNKLYTSDLHILPFSSVVLIYK